MASTPAPSSVLRHYAHKYLRDSLLRYGNEISADHDAALMALCELSERMMTGDLTGRIRFGLPCGMGKTTGIRAVIKAVHDLGLPFRIAVACSKVEELCQLRRTLCDEDGIARDRIGLQHSYRHDPSGTALKRIGWASAPSEGHDRQFLLLTHANVLSGAQKAWMADRDLVFFDESLIVGEAVTLPLRSNSPRSIQGEVGALGAMAGNGPGYAIVADWFRRTYDHLLAQAADGRNDAIVLTVPPVDADVEAAIPEVAALTDDQFPTLAALLKHAGKPSEFRVFAGSGGQLFLVRYAVAVPDVLTNVIVLDASDPIRQLVHYDVRMRRADDVLDAPKPLRGAASRLTLCKQHQRVQIHAACNSGGRTTMKRLFKNESMPWPVEKVIRLLKQKPDESFLIFTFKDRDGATYERQLRNGMDAAGIDPFARTTDGKPRVSILTWGQETGTNDYIHCTNVVLLGVIVQPNEVVAGRYLGQVDDIRSPQLGRVVQQLRYSECAHAIYQAINRCVMRQVEVIDGVTQAKPCSVYIWHSDPNLEDRLSIVLPGAPLWRPWRNDNESMTDKDAALLIIHELGQLAEQGHSRISLRALKQRVAQQLPSTTWQRARLRALVKLPHWLQQGASLVHVPAEAINRAA